MRLILASASPRRRELLTQAGFEFEVRAAEIDESLRAGEDAIAYVTRLAREKAEAVFAVLGDAQAIVLGADTAVVVDGEILGKPADSADAARMLRLLGGRTHRVVTGVAVVAAAGEETSPAGPKVGGPETKVEVAAEVTVVRFYELSDEEIAAYIATGEPMDKAGAYAIQGRAAKWIPRIEGCYFNVVGLPVALVSAMLEEQGKGNRE
jgi:septum formation protein